MFTRVAVVNRGEPAMRLIRAVRELNEQGGYGIRVIALHTEADRRARFVRAADESVCLRDVPTAGGAYVDHAELERALRATRADAAWVGWGFVAEDPAFAELCERLGVLFIGPPPQAMRTLADSFKAKLLAEQSGVPTASWDPAAYLERPATDARRIEVQVIADNHGTVWAPGVRDCSVQTTSNRLVAESRSLALTAEQAAELCTSTAAMVRAVGYRGVGSVEFLYLPTEKTFAFLKVNSSLPIEHPVTETTTGLDLVKLQLHLAAGEPLVGEAPPEVGHAIEVRLIAEDADQGSVPARGTVVLLNLPSGPGIRVDCGIAAGDLIAIDHDPSLAKIIAWGRDRSEALARLRCALRETTVVLVGSTTNKSILLDVLGRSQFASGEVDAGWLDRLGAPGDPSWPRRRCSHQRGDRRLRR